MTTSIYDFTVKDIDNQDLNLASLQGKVLLIVNTASKCGFTGQYSELVTLDKKYRQEGLEILAFPCDQFGHQEPGSSQQIKDFCSLTYAVDFRLMAKIDVNGATSSPLYQFLKHRSKGILGSSSIKWNFTKFLVSRDGKTIIRFAPLVKPLKLACGIQSLLNEV